MLGDKPLTAAILQDAPLADVRDITRAILLSPVFEELDKRSLLAAIIKLYPDVQAMVVGGDKSAAPEAGLIVSWVSLQRRKAELEDLVLKQIPQNSKDIGIARGYGDLRENHEFKSAKEMQTILMRRKAELEAMVMRAQGTDFSHPETSRVNLGTTVILRVNGQPEPIRYTILGAWDSDPARGIISYQTAVAQALLNHAVGDSVTFGYREATTTPAMPAATRLRPAPVPSRDAVRSPHPQARPHRARAGSDAARHAPETHSPRHRSPHPAA